MNISGALHICSTMRVSYGDRWLIRDDDGEYCVYERSYRARSTKECITTMSEEDAVRELMLGDTE